MTPQHFDFLRKLLRERSGLVLGEDKKYLIESRLSPVVQKNEFKGISELVEALRRPGSENLRSQVTEAMTINESFFFRDKVPFKNFEEVMVPHLIAQRSTLRKCRIWSAAASTGQEPYSLAIQIKEMASQLAGWRIDIVGTDISSEVLEKAKSGLYSQFEVQRGMPAPLLVKYFKQTGSLWQIDTAIKAMVKFQSFNLLDSFAPLGSFDIVFCRNVLIYFDVETKRDILNRIAKLMPSDGFLVLGAAETIVGITDEFKPVPERRGLYQRKDANPLSKGTAPATKPPLQVRNQTGPSAATGTYGASSSRLRTNS
jgi:chemotaxis protein methyltransferase CheR